MKLNTTIADKTNTISIEGSIDALTSHELEDEVNRCAGQCDKLILDMTGVDYISSAGLRVIVGASQTIGKANLTLRGLNANVMEIFNITGFSNVLNIE